LQLSERFQGPASENDMVDRFPVSGFQVASHIGDRIGSQLRASMAHQSACRRHHLSFLLERAGDLKPTAFHGIA
jgi:hypothetical protein